MNFAERILTELDSRLDSEIQLCLYGRAAFVLGFGEGDFAQSYDVDAVLWLGQDEELQRETNFWDALEQVNEVLAPEGLYMSHLFGEEQVILRPCWLDERVKLDGPWKNLKLWRLSDEDLLLSKLMRDDPQDRRDALYLIKERSWGKEKLSALMNEARVPQIDELLEEFEIAGRKLLEKVS